MPAPAYTLDALAGLPDADRLARIVARLDDADAAWVLTRCAPAWLQRQIRLARRDDAIRDLAALLAPGEPPATAARIVEAALRKYAGSGWQREKHMSDLLDAPPDRRLLHTILRANGGATIGARQLANVLAGARTPLP